MTTSSQELDRQGPPASVVIMQGSGKATSSCWPVNWSAVIVGALTAAGVVSIFGLIGLALGAHHVSDDRWVDLKKIGIGALILGLFGAFLSFVAGGWVAGKIADIRRSETAMLHGAVVWLVAVPMLFVFSTLGAGSLAGGWYAGLSGRDARVPYERPELVVNATPAERDAYRADLAEYNQKVVQWHADTPKVVRNTALGALTALLLGLVGGVIGGWLASGEPMTFTYHRTRPALT